MLNRVIYIDCFKWLYRGRTFITEVENYFHHADDGAIQTPRGPRHGHTQLAGSVSHVYLQIFPSITLSSNIYKRELRFRKKNPKSRLVPCWEKDAGSLTHYKESISDHQFWLHKSKFQISLLQSDLVILILPLPYSSTTIEKPNKTPI